MKRLIAILLMLTAFSASADEVGEKRLERISQHYSALGRYSVTFHLRVGDALQRGVLQVDGKNSYFKVADTEVFVEDGLRYEVRSSAKEIIVDKADIYEKELLNSLNGFTHLAADYKIEGCEIEGHAAVRLTPKKAGEVVYIILGADGLTISKLIYGAGANLVEVRVEKSEKSTQIIPRFSKERYNGFELVDFR
jgi:hypothetical protein